MKIKNEEGKIVEAKFDAFNFWECGYIGLNVVYSDTPGLVAMYDLKPAEAEKLIKDLSEALEIYRQLDKLAEEHQC